ncbi:hypothetical protein VIBNISOn1_450108 [Vibrio nigripulchritudo SOn1]|uniref:Transposase n=1 Tax=Vibrio nigripulchritudo SOn1 TaxID=1238450 RepID=A0AAV2VTU3_9VIBR|nr:hypothetical protein VIBNISFn118_930018 [Vibrio nigripulchritudo SFn118]CCO48144.1 hypothetical protein VIBNISOn1_450108 [Vibrio nigripulchritudo SOn1]
MDKLGKSIDKENERHLTKNQQHIFAIEKDFNKAKIHHVLWQIANSSR